MFRVVILDNLCCTYCGPLQGNNRFVLIKLRALQLVWFLRMLRGPISQILRVYESVSTHFTNFTTFYQNHDKEFTNRPLLFIRHDDFLVDSFLDLENVQKDDLRQVKNLLKVLICFYHCNYFVCVSFLYRRLLTVSKDLVNEQQISLSRSSKRGEGFLTIC